MKIEQILIQPIGQRFNAGTLTIKTCKKTWQVKDVWYHQVIFMDETGEIPADVKIGKYLPLNRGAEVKVIIAEVREAEYLGKSRKILFVDQYSVVTATVDDWNIQQEEDWDRMEDQIKGKIRHGLVCIARRELGFRGPLSQMHKEIIKGDVDFILTGE